MIDANNCSAVANVYVHVLTIPSLRVDFQHMLCGVDGAINVSVSGSFPFTFSFNGSNNTQQSGTKNWTGLPAGSYPISVTDRNGCTASEIALVENHSLAFQLEVENVPCPAGDKGEISINPFGGVTTYSYSLNGSAWARVTPFEVAPGVYNISVKDFRSCEVWQIATVTKPEPFHFSYTPNIAAESIFTCQNTNGTFRASATGGTPPYSWWLDTDHNIFIGDSHTFTNVPLDYGTLFFSDNNGCNSNQPFSFYSNSFSVYAYKASAPSCFGVKDGVIDIGRHGGAGGLGTFRIPNISLEWVNTSLFEGLSGYAKKKEANHKPNICLFFSLLFLYSVEYIIEAMDTVGCTASATIYLEQPRGIDITILNFPQLSEIRTTTDLRVSAPGLSDGLVVLSTTNNSQAPYYFSVNQTGLIVDRPPLNATFSGFSPGSYEFSVEDSAGCSFFLDVVIYEPTKPHPPSYITLQVVL